MPLSCIIQKEVQVQMEETLTYNIPVPNGTYTVRTHHAELWFGYAGPAGAIGNRVFDIFIEGNLVQNDFDMYAEGIGNGLSISLYRA